MLSGEQAKRTEKGCTTDSHPSIPMERSYHDTVAEHTQYGLAAKR